MFNIEPTDRRLFFQQRTTSPSHSKYALGDIGLAPRELFAERWSKKRGRQRDLRTPPAKDLERSDTRRTLRQQKFKSRQKSSSSPIPVTFYD
jgi:hypothetical protein